MFEEYANAGIALFPCNPDKSPRTAHGFKDATVQPLDADMAGMPCGEIVAIDIDAKNDPGLYERFLKECQRANVDISNLPIQRTPNGGGAHLFFRPANEIRNERLASTEDGKVIIETRGKGGYVCVYPSQGYSMERGKIWEAPSLDADHQDALLSVCRSLNRKEQPAWEPRKVPWERTQGESPGDAYNQRGEVFTLLREHGWHPIDRDATKWRRPGKATGISATWDKIPGKFYVFTSSSELEPGKAYSPFALYTYLEYDGNFNEAAKALAAEGYGEDSAQSGNHGVDLSALLERAHSLRAKIEEAESTAPDGDDLFVDMAAILSGDMSPELPTIGKSDDGHYLFYAGRLNELHAEPGVGKTNIALASVARILNDGGCVVFVDPEDNPRAIARRLISMGADANRILTGFKYLHDPDRETLIKCRRWVEANGAVLVVIDGAAELISGTGGSERDEDDVLRFFKVYVRPFADAGAAILITDHVAKDSESAGLWPRGSGAKMGRYDGAVYLIRTTQDYSPEQAGEVKLIVAKDRNGGVGPKKTTAFVVRFDPENGKTRVTIERPTVIKNEDPDTNIEKKIAIMEALKGGPLSVRELRNAVGGRGATTDLVRDELAELGHIEVRDTGVKSKIVRAIREYFPCYNSTVRLIIRTLENEIKA